MTEGKRVRGAGIKPRMVYRAIRIPRDVLEHYETHFKNPSQKMREVLAEYVQKAVDVSDTQEVDCNHGSDSREEGEGQSSQDSEGT